MSSQKPSEETFNALIRESEALEERMADWQAQPSEPDPAVVAEVRGDYRRWHARARRLLEPDAQKKFDECRDGGIFLRGVSYYLDNPRELSALRADDGSYPLGRWQQPFSQIREKLERQRTLIAEAAPDASPAETVAIKLSQSLRRLPELLATLQRRAPDWPISESIRDEADLQIMVEAYLRTLFEDVRPEDYVSSHAGANSRVDFVLPEAGVIVETKMTRESLTTRKLGEELLIDAGRYPSHPNCEAIVAFIYDPARRIVNPRGVERDLTTRTSSGLSFLCVIAS
ncbi:hypothetical protein [Kocuria sp.]|uniref:PD-(D/E)XK nuclease domain-containing protein n=1 Tax=Kocuria sp. TaxID=1871328 RepID=UPI0026DF5244|nr:hypothetical protein [Kocuria sp.]MDO5367459.1 hypothetical protein [Kocuria sp.]